MSNTFQPHNTHILNAYLNVRQRETINEGGLGMLIGGIINSLSGPIGILAKSYLGRKIQELGFKQFISNISSGVGRQFVGSLVSGPLGALAGSVGGFSISAKESVVDEGSPLDENTIKNTFAYVMKMVDKSLKTYSVQDITNAKTALESINKSDILDALDQESKERLAKIYVYIAIMYGLKSQSTDKNTSEKIKEITRVAEKDVISAAANLLNSDKS